ncbi:abscisic acid receptor PYR1 [Carex littledalei]|uniref:Abscisic acid receptor PYR1 n=1 Tax=Carex littledalei TaxID=544730 RepID=A0A833RCZ0_9POAL|nr:abscisic acid receptor PYR1 [Carex littledalei]
MDEAATHDSEPSHQSASVASPPPPVQQPPVGLTPAEYASLAPTIDEYHTYQVGPGRCSSLLSQRIRCPSSFVWSVVRRFDCPQIYKHFIRSCSIIGGGGVQVGCLRELSVISGLPASTSTERLDILDEERKVTGFTIIGGEHRLRNYKSVTSVNQFEEGGEIWTVVLESYVVDVPPGNSEEDTRLFADTVIKLNLQKLKSVAEAAAAAEVRNS